MSRQADPLRELVRLVRHPDQQCHNIGLHLRAHANVLGPALSVDQDLLQAMSDQPDHLLASKLAARLRAVGEQRARERAESDSARAHAAARQLAETARWDGPAVMLEPAVLLGELLADPSVKFITFGLPELDVPVERVTLVATAKGVGSKRDLSCTVDCDGLHLRWHGGLGGLNWYPQPVSGSDRHRVLRVALREPDPAPKTARAQRPAWSWDAFAELPFSP